MKIQNEKTPSDAAAAPWTAPALWRFGRNEVLQLPVKSGRKLSHSKTLRQFGCFVRTATCVVFAAGLSASAADLPSDWQHEQTFNVSTTGLVKINLPVETLDAARPALEDLRLYDDAGNEIPYVLTRPAPSPKVIQKRKIISGFAQRQQHRHHAGNRTGATARCCHPRNSGRRFHQSRARRRFGRRQELADARPGPADFPPVLWRSQFEYFHSARRGKMAAADGGRPAFAAGSVYRRAGPRRHGRNGTGGNHSGDHHRARRKSRRNAAGTGSRRGESGRRQSCRLKPPNRSLRDRFPLPSRKFPRMPFVNR